MPSGEAARANMPALIQDTLQVYHTDPIAAALMLHKGIRGLTTTTTPSFNEGPDQQPASHDESVLQSALWSLDVMGEDARLGIAPTPCEWDLHISVAQSIINMLAAYNDPA